VKDKITKNYARFGNLDWGVGSNSGPGFNAQKSLEIQKIDMWSRS